MTMGYDKTPNPQVPSHMRVVSEKEFFSRIGPMNVHPCNDYPDRTDWRYTGGQQTVGMSFPGWKYPGREEVYMLPK
jgi:hypothetical protein